MFLITIDPNLKGERVEAESERPREPRVWGFGKHDRAELEGDAA